MDVKLLIVDRHPTMRESLRFVFQSAGIGRVEEAEGLDQALGILRTASVDVVLLDASPYDHHGTETLSAIQSLDPSLPVVVHSYCDNCRLRQRCQQLGAAGYLVKGTDKDLLLEAIWRAAAGRRVWLAPELPNRGGSPRRPPQAERQAERLPESPPCPLGEDAGWNQERLWVDRTASGIKVERCGNYGESPC